MLMQVQRGYACASLANGSEGETTTMQQRRALEKQEPAVAERCNSRPEGLIEK
mgnify:CR=1 FL=1